MNQSNRSHEFIRVRQAVMLGLFSGTGIGLGYLLAGVPGVELMSLNAALAGVALGPVLGAVAGALAVTIYSLGSPFGPPVPLILGAQILTMAVAGLLGGWLVAPLSRLGIGASLGLAGAVGFVYALGADLLTSLAIALTFSAPFWPMVVTGALVTALHLATCTVGFALVLPAMAGRLSRLRRPGLRVARTLALVLVSLSLSGEAVAQEAVADSLAVPVDSLTTTSAVTDTLLVAPVDSLAAKRLTMADSNESAPRVGHEKDFYVNGWERPLWNPFFGSFRDNLLQRTYWLPMADGGQGAATIIFGEPGTSVAPEVRRDGIPMGMGHRYIDDMETVATVGRTLDRAHAGLNRGGGLGGEVDLGVYDPVPDRDLADTRWFKGKHETYLRDLHLLTANAPWRLGFDYEEMLDNEGYDFRVDGEGRYDELNDEYSDEYWGQAKFRSGRGSLTRDMGESGTVGLSLENVRKLKTAMPAYDIDFQDLWQTRASLDWRAAASARPARLAFWFLDTDVDWDRGVSGRYRKQEGARTGVLASLGDARDGLRFDANWSRWTLLDSGANEDWAPDNADTSRVQGEQVSLAVTKVLTGDAWRADFSLGTWWDQYGDWLLGGSAILSENRDFSRWKLELEHGGRAPRSDELATAWRFYVPDGRQSIALPNMDLDREDEWRLAGSVHPRLVGFDLALEAGLRRLRHGIGWRQSTEISDTGRWENGLELDSATIRGAVARQGRFLGWVRAKIDGSWRTWSQQGDLRTVLPPNLDWQLSLLWENHFFQEDGILQLAWYYHNRGSMNDPWFIGEDYALPTARRLDMILGFRLVGTNLSVEFLNLTGEAVQLSAGSMLHGMETRWRLKWVFHY